ncbi:MAG: carbohydrate kinase, partial [Lachnospiraceae bacterium]|nr:carbohydrate kinase [Lachnospiraceae bacterium]
RVGMLTKVGDDDFGHFLFRTLRENGVEILSPEMTKEAMTTLAFVSLTEAGERSFTFGRKPGADMFLSKEDVKEEDLQETTILHTGSFGLSGGIAKETTIETIRRARALQKLVSFDINYRNVAWDDDKAACTEEVTKLLPCIDLLKVSDEEVDMLGGEEKIPQVMQENDIAVVIETLGADGAKCFFRGESYFCEPYKAPKVVDTTGAGDAFWGGFLAQLIHHGVKATSDLTKDILLDAVDYGSVSGSICVRAKGAISSLPTREEIEAFRRENPRA